jgi:hypothetical protein
MKFTPEGNVTVGKYLQASTGNVSEATAELLNNYSSPDRDAAEELPALPPTYQMNEYGWWVFVPVNNDGIAPPELCDLLDEARRLGCNWIEFDRDNDPLDDFPLFDW